MVRELLLVDLFELMDLFEPTYLLERVVVRLLLTDPRILTEGLFRVTDVLVERRVLTVPLDVLEDVRGREIVLRLDVLRVELRLEILLLEFRLDVIELERLGVELRVDILGALLRVDTLGALERLELLALVEGEEERELELAALRLLLLLPELPLFRELRAAQTGPAINVKSKRHKVKHRKTGILTFDL